MGWWRSRLTTRNVSTPASWARSSASISAGRSRAGPTSRSPTSSARSPATSTTSCGVPLIVTDDDITGTFTFFRALEDSGYDPDLGSEAVGRAWLNYLIENRTILWWGGLGHSTEHTAYLRLKSGIPAPRSGSAELNGQVTSEQIGAQIFIDAWAMASPGDPARAAALARTAARVSHDGEAVHAAALLAAMEAQAFVEGDLDRLLDTGLSFIPRDSVIAGVIGDLRDWRVGEPDWRVARERLADDVRV